jgi:hypothetical protein
MRMCLHQLVLFGAMVLVFPLAAWAQGEPRLVSLVGRHFEIVGTDQRSVSCANALGLHVAKLCQSQLQARSHAFLQPIFVALRPDERVDFEGHYRVRLGPRGGVTLDFRWDASLSLETACRAFVEAYVVRYAHFNYGPQASQRVRYWALSALGTQSYLSLRHAQKIQFLQDARDASIAALTPVLDLNVSSAVHAQVEPQFGYWLWLAMHESGLRRAQIGYLLDQAIAGVNVTDALTAMIAPNVDDLSSVRLEAWWRSQLERVLARDYGQCERMDVSRDWIAELVDFSDYREAGGDFENLASLWQQREDEALRALLIARYKIIRLRIERVNPAYFNAARSLGALYETVLEGERDYQFLSALTAYLTDWLDTLDLHQDMLKLLDAD